MDTGKMTFEDVALRYSGRGMDAIRPCLAEHFFRETAARLLQRGGTVLITTGFYVAGVCETDGPPGAFCMALTLKNLGYSPVIVTDALCAGLFNTLQIPVIYAPLSTEDDYWNMILDEYAPCAMISTERCGKNQDGDYANMRGVSIANWTASVDRMFELALDRGIYTVGIGDGGNEIGMGNVQERLKECTDLNPCAVRTSDLLIATTSNWGAYALCAALTEAPKRRTAMPDYETVANYISDIAARGCVDGIKHIARPWVDGFPPETEEEIYTGLQACRS